MLSSDVGYCTADPSILNRLAPYVAIPLLITNPRNANKQLANLSKRNQVLKQKRKGHKNMALRSHITKYGSKVVPPGVGLLAFLWAAYLEEHLVTTTRTHMTTTIIIATIIITTIITAAQLDIEAHSQTCFVGAEVIRRYRLPSQGLIGPWIINEEKWQGWHLLRAGGDVVNICSRHSIWLESFLGGALGIHSASWSHSLFWDHICLVFLDEGSFLRTVEFAYFFFLLMNILS